MIDKPENYYNFTHPNKWVQPKSFIHRLGQFQCAGIPKRQKPVSVIVLHIPDYDYVNHGIDITCEKMAGYLADPVDRNISSVHAFSDRDSFILSMPSDTVVYGCANQNTRQESIEIEIGGNFKHHANQEYWHTADAKLKLINTVKALKQLQILCNYDMPPLQIAKLDAKGTVVIPGFIQHRDIPIWAKGEWQQPPKSWELGQHKDICENFPYEILFDIFNSIK